MSTAPLQNNNKSQNDSSYTMYLSAWKEISLPDSNKRKWDEKEGDIFIYFGVIVVVVVVTECHLKTLATCCVCPLRQNIS